MDIGRADTPVLVQDGDSGFTLDASMIARHFGWSADLFRALQRRGLVKSLIERGEGDDQGRWRLTVRCGGRRWRAIVEADGTILEHHLERVSRRNPP